MTDSPETGSNNGSLSFANAASSWSKLLLVGPHLQATMMAKALERQHDMLGFLDRRCQAELALTRAISAASSLTDVYAACTGYARNAMADYSAQLRVAAEHGTQDALDAARATQESVSNAAAEMRVAA